MSFPFLFNEVFQGFVKLPGAARPARSTFSTMLSKMTPLAVARSSGGGGQSSLSVLFPLILGSPNRDDL